MTTWRTRTSTAENPPRKVLSRERVEAKQRKAVDFLRNVIGDDLVPRTDKTGHELADEIEAMSLEEYAEKKKISLANPHDRAVIEYALSQLPLQASREDRARAIAQARAALEELPPDASEADKIEAAREAVASVVEELEVRQRREEERQRREEEHQQRQRELELAESRRRSLINRGKQSISTYLYRLYLQDEIDREEALRPDPELAIFVEQGLEDQLIGDETWEQVREVAEALVDEFLFEDEEPEDDDEPDEEDGDENY